MGGPAQETWAAPYFLIPTSHQGENRKHPLRTKRQTVDMDRHCGLRGYFHPRKLLRLKVEAQSR